MVATLTAQGIAPGTMSGKPNGRQRKVEQEQVGGRGVVPVSCGYPPGYLLLSIVKQIEVLAEIFNIPSSSTGRALSLAKSKRVSGARLPDGAEGWFAVPSVDGLARRKFPEVTDPAEKYCRACKFALRELHSMLSKIDGLGFHNYRPEQIVPDRFWRTKRTALMLAEISKQQYGDILLIPAQFGLLHRGESVQVARTRLRPREFGLGLFEGTCMLLVHPNREQKYEQLHIDLPGDESCDPDVSSDHDLAPHFYFSSGEVYRGSEVYRGGKIRLGMTKVTETGIDGSVTGFMPLLL